MKRLALMVAILGAGCAVRQPAPLTYRVTSGLLVPPGVPNADVQQSSFVAAVLVRACDTSVDGPVTLQIKGKHSRVTVRRDSLIAKPGDWLSEWGASLETRGCVAKGDGWKLSMQVAESVPMDSRVVFRLLYGDAIDIGPQVRIQVDSPILANEGGLILEATTFDGVSVTAKGSSNLLGYERAWYAVKAKTAGDGSRIVAVWAERYVNGATENTPQPARNYLMFPSEAGYYRLIYKQEQTDYTALVVAGRSRAELDGNAGKLTNRGASCGLVEKGYCLPVPKGVAANLFLPVTVNGKEQLIHWGGTVGDAVGRSSVMSSTLAITRLYKGKPVAVEFDRSSNAVLGLRLVGGETISWR